MAQTHPISPNMNAVSDWIQSCASFDNTLNPTHQQLFQQYHYNPLNSLPHYMNSNMLAAMTLVSSPSPPALSTMDNNTHVESANAVNMMIPEAPRNVEYIDTVVWPHFTSSAATVVATGANAGASSSAFLELPVATVGSSILWGAHQDAEAVFVSNCHDQISANEFQAGIFGHDVGEQQRQQSYFPAATFTAPIAGSMSTMNAMGAGTTNDQFSAMMYSWSPNCDSTTLPPSSVSSSPCLSSSIPPANTASSSSSASSLYSSSSSPYLRSSTPSSPYSRATTINNNNNSGTQLSSSLQHKFKMRPMSMLTCRQQAMLRSQSDASGSLPFVHSMAMTEPSHSYTSSSSTSISAPTSSSFPSSTMSNTPLTCQICRKKYANNSTLRRHLKIHLYANSSSRALAVLRSNSSSPLSSSSFSTHSSSSIVGGNSGGAMSHRPLLCSGLSNLSLGDHSSPSLLGEGGDVEGGVYIPSISSSNLSSSMIISGYNPSSDPDIKKPECVGCNKAFARRDTVILHIKNQKRKWDLLSAMLPTLTTSSTPSPTFSSLTEAAAGEDSVLDQLPFSDTAAGVVVSNKKAGASASGGARRVQRQRRSHPLRMVEKLWQSTLQKKRLLLASTGPSSDFRVKKVDGAEISDEDVEDEQQQEQHRQDGDEGEDTEPEEASEDGWPSFEAISRMDSQTKLKWMMKTMVMPPCWRERKVRLFGAFGVLEEKVLQ